MDIALSIAGLCFVAFCVWIVVRIVNRREPWAIWTAVLLVEGAALAVSGYAIMHYNWMLSSTQLSPAMRATVEFDSRIAKVVFGVMFCAAVAAFAVFLWRANSRVNPHAPNPDAPAEPD